MNIAFDAKRYFHNKTGLGNYSRFIINQISELFPEHNYFLCDSKPKTDDLNSNFKLMSSEKKLWRQWFIKNDLEKNNINVYHGLSNELPLGKFNFNLKKIVTIHDVIFKEFPEQYPFFDRLIYDLKTSKAIENADVITATSQFTIDKIKHYYPKQSQNKQFEVIYQDVHPIFKTKINSDLKLKILNKFELPNKFLLYVSSFEERKNHLLLLKALKNISEPDLYMVFVGKPYKKFEKIIEFIQINSLENKVKIFPNLNLTELATVYQLAHGFVYPSMIEGFGIPLLEALYSGLNIACSDIGIFREIGGKNSTYFDLNNLENISNSILEIWNKSNLNYQNQYLEKFNPELNLKNLMKIYTK